MARAADSSQFDWKRRVACTGRTSVCPSTRITQLISGGILLLELEDGARPACRARRARRRRSRRCRWRRAPRREARSGRRPPRSPGRSARIWRSRPKKSERYCDSSCTRCASATFSRLPRSAICVWLSLLRLSEAFSASSSAPSWRRSAAICWFRSSTCASARWLTCFSVSRLALERRDPSRRRAFGGAAAVDQALQAVALALRRGEIGLQAWRASPAGRASRTSPATEGRSARRSARSGGSAPCPCWSPPGRGRTAPG